MVEPRGTGAQSARESVLRTLEHAFVQQGMPLKGSGELGDGDLGYVVALSGDGTTALVGAPGDDRFRGAVWVFTRTGSRWHQQGPKLTGAGEAGACGFGFSVALSSDGDTALVGCPGDHAKRGAVWVFRRRGANWRQEGRKLTADGEAGAAEFGAAVALSASGTVALVGGPDDRRLPGDPGNDGYGAVWVFGHAGSAWKQLGAKLTGKGDPDNGDFGTAVALAGNGGTALVGAFNAGEGRGAAWVFHDGNSGWYQQGAALRGTGAVSAGVNFGESVALSRDGNTALVGGPGDSDNRGAAWVFTRSRSTWSQQGLKLLGQGGSGPLAAYGVSVALSATGNEALIGGWDDNYDRGAVWVASRTRGHWSQVGAKLTAQGANGTAPYFGEAVALAAAGRTAAIGAPGDDGKRGAVLFFASAS